MRMSTFQNAIGFFINLGVYDVVLPFLLVFTLVFAMLEKTKILGLEELDGKKVTKKNLNAMFAFVTGFLVIASAELVRIINTVVANSVLLLVFAILFLMLAGSFHKDEEFFLKKGWNMLFMGIMFVGIVLIFLGSMGWLQAAWWYMSGNIDGAVVGSVLMLLVVLAAIFLIVHEPNSGSSESKS